MTVEDCLKMVDSVCPTEVEEGIKLQFLNEIEGRVRVELLGEEPGTVPFGSDGDYKATLSAPPPYDRLYWLYVVAMLYYVGGYTERYERSAALFNTAYRDYGKWLRRKGD